LILCAAIATAIATAWAPSPALAEPNAQQKELARDLMQKGRDARNAHDLKLALQSFKGADEIMHVATTGFEVARSQVDLGLLVEAHETLLAVMRIPESPAEPQAFRDARGYARVLDDDIAPRIPQLRISLGGAAPPHGDRSLAIAVDGVTLPREALLVPYKVDPGHHVVTAKSDTAEGRAEVDVAERQTNDVTVTLAAVTAATPAPVAGPAQPEPAPEHDAPATEHGGGGPGAIGWTGFAVAAAGVGIGAVTGILTLSDKSSIASRCNGTHCPPSTYGDLSSANTMATVSTVAFAVGAAGAAVGVVAWLLGRQGPPEAPPPVARATPAVGLGTIGLAGTF
jgi:hypothetical protein